MRRKLIGAVVGVFLSAMPAAATVVQATFKGTVSFGTDMLGLWGVAGGDLAQKSADLTFLFDTALGTPVNGPYVRHGVWGGTLIGATTPVLSSTVKIGGVTISSDASYFGYAALLSDPTFGQSEQFQARGTATGSMGQSYTTQINAFFGSAAASDLSVSVNASTNAVTVSYSGPAEWSFRRFILHYAKLCTAINAVDAGAVDGIFDGSAANQQGTDRTKHRVGKFLHGSFPRFRTG